MEVIVKVLYFGAAEAVTGRKEEEFIAGDTGSLRRQLISRYPELEGIPFRMALNRALLKGESGLQKSDIIAILPPFQGG